MTTKYYLDLDGLKALIQKIVANDNTEAGLRKSITGQQDTYVVPTVTASTNYLTGANNLSEADAKLSDAIAGIQTSVSANNFRLKKLASTDAGYSANWASQYRLERGTGDNWTNISDSDTINIAKDQFLKNVEVVSTFPSGEGAAGQPGEGTTLPALRFEWDVVTDSDEEAPDKSKSITYVSIADFWKDTIVQGGTNINVTGGDIAGGARTYQVNAVSGSVGTAATGSTVLPTATTDATKLATVGDVVTGVNSAINNMAFSSASTGGSKVTVNVAQSAGKITGVTVSESDIASAQGLADEITRATGVEGGLDTRLTTAEGDIDNLETGLADEVTRATDAEEALGTKIDNLGSTYKALQTAVSDNGTVQPVTSLSQDEQGVVTPGKTNLQAIALTGYQKGVTAGDIAAADTLGEGLSKVEKRLDALETSSSASRLVVNNDVITVDNSTANQQKLTVTTGNGLDKSDNALVVKPADNTISVTANGVATTLKIEKLTTPNTGYAASYRLVDGTGAQIANSTDIDIIKDQFLKGVSYVTEAPATPEGNSASITFPALRFEWELDTDDQTAGDQKVTYVSIAALGATGAFGTVDTTTGAIAPPTAAGLATVGDVTSTVNTVRTSLNANQTSSNGNNVNVTVTETNGLISAVSVADNTKNVVANDVYTVADGDTAGTQKLTISVDGTTITKANGALAANTGELNYTEGTSSADATLTPASGDANKLATVGDVADKVEDFVNDRIADEIAELNLADTYKAIQTAVADSATVTASDTDAVVTAVTQDTQGVVTVTKNNVGNMLMTGYSAKTGATTDDVQATDSVNAAIKKLEEKVDAIQTITANWVNGAFDAVVANPSTPTWPAGN